jgi:signal transduction histidine kinase/ActR/RegA family two-component response regulator
MAEMERENTPRSVLVFSAETQFMPVLQAVLSGQVVNAIICHTAEEFCEKIADQADAFVISGDVPLEKTISRIAQALTAHPELSDVPIIVSVPRGAVSPAAKEAMLKLGNVLPLDYPFELEALQFLLQFAFRSKDKLRGIRDLEEEGEKAKQTIIQLRRMTGELILSEQNERRRLAKILHDHLQQLLVSAKYRIAFLNRATDPSIKAAAQEVEELLSEVIEASRSLTSELSPPIVYESTLRTGIEWLVSYMAAQNGLEVRLKMDQDISPEDPNIKILLFESIRELLLNVAKHARIRSAEISVNEVERNRLEITVSDEGVGFQPAMLEHKGIGFFRIQERMRSIGARFKIQSAPGQGSRFTILAPLERSQADEISAGDALRVEAKSPIAHPPKPVSATIRVLIVDDHAVMRQGLFTTLSQEPDIVIVGEATDGIMALERSRNLHPDVVLMDLSMPKMNGIEATKKMHAEMPGIQVIGLSMFDERERANSMLEAGAVAYLSKGCNIDALTAAIRRCAGKLEPRSA